MSSSFVRTGILYLSLVLVFVVGAYGQEAPPSQAIPAKLTLDTATEILLVANPTLLRTREGIAIARADVITARALPNPDLEVNSESYPLFESHPGSFVNNQELVVRTSQTIETAGKRGKRTRVAQQDVAVAEANLQDTVRQLKLELRQRYYSVVLAKAESSLAQDILKQFDEIIRLNQARFDQGEVSGLDLARVQTERLRFFQRRDGRESSVEDREDGVARIARNTESGDGVRRFGGPEVSAISRANCKTSSRNPCNRARI